MWEDMFFMGRDVHQAGQKKQLASVFRAKPILIKMFCLHADEDMKEIKHGFPSTLHALDLMANKRNLDA